MKAGRSTLRRRMLIALLCCFVPMVAVISLLFVRAFGTQQAAEEETLLYGAQDIRAALDRFADGVYSVSDAFSTDERLIELLDRDYSADPVAKQYAITYTNNALFESYSRLVHQEKIDAIYIPARREVLDFRDPNQVTTLLVKKFEELAVDDPDKMGRFYFYPLQKNFLSTETYGEPRRDMVVLGSRRVYSALKSGYPYIHIFAVEEQTLYDLYQYQAKRLGADVYILTEDGALISSTDEAAVAAGQAPAALLASAAALGAGTDSIRLDGEQYNAAAAVCHSTDWRVLVLVPTRTLLASTFSLYFQILGVVALCLVVFAVLIWHFYRRFMAPLAQLEQAMRQADAGDLKAYVKPQGSVEVVRMMEGYNAMLDSLRTGIEQQMEMQRRRQDLEMQVLMSQINPHFLYNTLESIVWKAGEAGRPDIGKLASSLGKLYRLSISGGLFVPLEQELEHVQMYMNIQRSRYGNKSVFGDSAPVYDDGQTYGLPAFTDVWCTFINTKVFENAGVEIPSAEGWTWEKYIETAQKLTNLDEEIYGSLMLDYDCYNYMYALQNGAEHYKEDGTSNYDDPRFRDSVEFFYSLGNELQIQPDITTYKAGVYPWNAFPSTGVANADGSYDKAQFGMFVCGGWAASMLPDTEKYPRDWQCVILPMPYPEGQEPSTLTVPGCYAVPSTSKNKEAAFEAVRCIAENQYTLGYGRVPARVDLTDEETTDYIENGLVPTYAATDNIPAEQFKAAWFDPTRKVLSEKIVGTADTTISQIWTSEAPLYGMGQQDLDTTMQNILDRSNEAIKEAELY